MLLAFRSQVKYFFLRETFQTSRSQQFSLVHPNLWPSFFLLEMLASSKTLFNLVIICFSPSLDCKLHECRDHVYSFTCINTPFGTELRHSILLHSETCSNTEIIFIYYEIQFSSITLWTSAVFLSKLNSGSVLSFIYSYTNSFSNIH